MNTKPIVRYVIEGPARPMFIKVGESAVICPLAHPSSYVTGDGSTFVRTSRVLAYNEKTGRLETENTIYIPED